MTAESSSIFSESALLAALLAIHYGLESCPALSANPQPSGALWPRPADRGVLSRIRGQDYVSSLRSYGTGTSDPYQDTLVLGGPRNVGNILVMDVRVADALPYGVYWQAITYDTYANGSWRSVDTSGEPAVHYPDDGPLDIPFNLARDVITQTVTNYLPNSSFLYAAPEVLNTDRQMLVDATYDPDGRTLVTSLRSRFILRQGDQYQVSSRVSVADGASLRAATTDYPQWVIDRYLQLPETVSPETLALAGQLTEGLDNPYEKALAVRDYLRTNISYNDQIAAAPDGVDPVHYTLFDIREGYCTYYASAMAVMLRSQGIPSRLVSGYALGEYDNLSQNYRVRAENAHTWVEVYFPGYGWIQFEPTQSIPVVERPDAPFNDSDFPGFSSPVSPADRESLLPEEDLLDVERGGGLLGDLESSQQDGFAGGSLSVWRVLIGIGLMATAGVSLLLANNYNRRVEGDIDRSFGRLGNWAHRLGISWRETQTPYEQADNLIASVPESRQPVRNLTRQFVLRRFSPTKTTDPEFDPRQEWRTLRPLLLKQSVIRFLDRSRGRKK
jgi:transglutaminase-like putative cysteine protease